MFIGMKQAWQIAPLILLALLIVQPVMADLVCAPPVSSNVACATCTSPVEQPNECPKLPTPVVQGQDSCCHLGVPDSAQQTLVTRSKPDQGIGHSAIERPLPWVALPAQRGLEPNRVLSAPLSAASLQSLYCTFLE